MTGPFFVFSLTMASKASWLIRMTPLARASRVVAFFSDTSTIFGRSFSSRCVRFIGGFLDKFCSIIADCYYATVGVRGGRGLEKKWNGRGCSRPLISGTPVELRSLHQLRDVLFEVADVFSADVQIKLANGNTVDIGIFPAGCKHGRCVGVAGYHDFVVIGPECAWAVLGSMRLQFVSCDGNYSYNFV